MAYPGERACPVVSRVDIAWVCVATNDPHPLHLDHEFARNAGFKDVVVPAHLVIGWIGEYLEDWCGGPENLVDWRLRFTAPVWPGDRITLSGAVGNDRGQGEGGTTTVTVTATTEDGRVVGQASAELRL